MGGTGLAVAGAWLLMPLAAVPTAWRRRAVPMALVTLGDGDVVLGDVRADEPVRLLDARELEFARLAARGLPHDEIAAQLRVSRRTVERRLRDLRERLGARSAAELAAMLSKSGLS